MYINIFLSTFIIFFISYFSPVLAAEQNRFEGEFKSNNYGWIPPRLTHQQQIKIIQTIAEEREINAVAIDSSKDLKAETGSFHNFGFSFPQCKPIHTSCLMKICELYSARRSRIQVGDFGAGHGFMTWKMIVAGGHVTAVEQVKSAAQVMLTNTAKARESLAEGEILKNVCTLQIGNMLNFSNLPAYKKSYDVTWSGNLIHFFTQKQATDYVNKLYEITNPGGYAFAIANAIAGSRELIDFFLQQQRQGEEFPGCFMFNKTVTFQTANTPNQPDQKISTTYSIISRGDGRSPSKSYYGFYEDPKENSQAAMFDVEYQYGETTQFDMAYPKYKFASYEEAIGNRIKMAQMRYKCTGYKVAYHNAAHYFDTISFKGLFERAGFLVEDVFLTDNDRRLDASSLSVEEMLNKVLYVNIVARRQT